MSSAPHPSGIPLGILVSSAPMFANAANINISNSSFNDMSSQQIHIDYYDELEKERGVCSSITCKTWNS